jgi:hypothetical protein
MELHMKDDARRDDLPGRSENGPRPHDDEPEVARHRRHAGPARLRELREAIFDIDDFRAIADFAGIRREAIRDN